MDNIHLINNNKFKGIYISFNYTLDIEQEDISKYAILASILSKSSCKYKNQTEIEKYLFELNGSTFDTSVQKLGDLYNLEFSMEFVNKKYIKGKDMLIPCLNFLREIIYNPIVKEQDIDNNFFETEIKNMLNRIKGIKDEKMQYAISQTEKLISPNTLFGGNVYGDKEIILSLSKKDIINAYNIFINSSCLNIIISGNLDGYDDISKNIENVFKKDLKNNLSYKELIENKKESSNEFEEKIEKDILNQSIITFALKIKDVTKDDFYNIMMYNSILGGTASSKLFQIFREKESLAYTVRSRYYRFKNVIIIYAGIDINNYARAKEVINNQINEMIDNISDEEFYSAKESLLSDFNEWDDSKVVSAKMKLSNMLSFKTDTLSIEEMYDNLKKVTLDDVKNIAKRIYVSKIYLLGGANDE